MPTGAPWSVKGIDPRARAIAKTAARKEGLTLGEWLNRVILDDGEPGPSGWDDQLEGFPGFAADSTGGDGEDALRQIVERVTQRLEASERRSTLALSGLDQSIAALTRRLDSLEDGVEESADSVDSQLSRTQHEELLERIRKIERGGPGGADPAALKAVENALGKLAGRLYETERDMRTELDTLAHREEDRGAEARKAIKSIRSLADQVAESETKLAAEQRELRERLDMDARARIDAADQDDSRTRALQSRLIAAENATQQAAQALASSQERLDQRLRGLEAGLGSTLDAETVNQRFEYLGRELAELIRETRADCARQISEVTAGTADASRFESALAATEKRQSDTLERIGTEVARLARAVDRRIEDAERRLEHKFSETEHRREGRESRVDIEQRLDRVREENSVAVRRIGEQMARLGESLADRVHQAEERSAQAVEQAGERMAQVVEKLETKRTQAGDLDERIRASEARTAERIDQAMEGVHARLDQARTETADALSPVQRAMTALADRLEAIETRAQSDSPKAEASVSAPAPAAAGATASDSFETTVDLTTPLPQPPGLQAGAGEWDEDPGTVADSFVTDVEIPQRGQTHLEPPTPFDRDEFGDATPPAPQRKARPATIGATADADFLAAARKSVRANGHQTQWSPPPEPDEGGGSKRLLIGASLLGFVAVAAAAGMLAMEAMSGESPATDANASTSLSTLFSEPAGTQTQEPAVSAQNGDALAPETSDSSVADAELEAPPVDTPVIPASAPVEPTQTAAETVSEPATPRPQPIAVRVVAPTLEEAATQGNPIARYQLAVRQLESGAVQEGLILMQRAAEQGVPDAMRQFGVRLARGEGLPADPDAGRAMVIAAAEAGNVQAMEDAASLFIAAQNVPGAEDAAARWFQQGALHGLNDSQFNMALLFQEGFGVARSPADAYAWFTIAANNGDADARQRANAIRQDLTPEQRAAAEAAARDFQPRPVNASAQGQYPAQAWDEGAPGLITRTQTLLAQLGYNPGPADGVMGERTRQAIVSYQSQTGLEPGAPVDLAFVARLEQSATQ